MEKATKLVTDLVKTKYSVPIERLDKTSRMIINGKKVSITYIGSDEDGEYFDLSVINGSKLYSADFYVKNGSINKDILTYISRSTL